MLTYYLLANALREQSDNQIIQPVANRSCDKEAVMIQAEILRRENPITETDALTEPSRLLIFASPSLAAGEFGNNIQLWEHLVHSASLCRFGSVRGDCQIRMVL